MSVSTPDHSATTTSGHRSGETFRGEFGDGRFHEAAVQYLQDGGELGDTARVRFRFEAGAVIRRQVRTTIEDFCFTRRVDCQVSEDRGWLDSVFRFRCAGTVQDLLELERLVSRLIRAFSDDSEN